MNVYQDVFTMVFANNMDSWECFTDLHLYWDTPWGGFVTIKIESSQAIFRSILNFVQVCTDLLMKNDHLLQSVKMDAMLVASVGSKLDITPLTLPFLIMTLQVPKNFIKKLIGYQVRVLSELRKRYEVEFEYE